MADPQPNKLEPFLLGWGVSFVGMAAVLCLQDWLTAGEMGLAALAAAALFALLVGSAAGLLLGRLLDPPDFGGGGRAILVASAAVVLAVALRPSIPADVPWDAWAGVQLERLWWIPVLAVASAPTALLGLRLGPDEPFADGRFRRAAGFWLAAGGAPLMGTLLWAGSDGIGPVVVTLLVPLTLLLGAFGVRIHETELHRRTSRLRLAAVSGLATVAVLAVESMRELIG